MRRVLFLCSRNRLRSPTAEEVFADRDGIVVDSAGLSKDANCRLCAEQVEWAGHIVVMEKDHRRRLNEQFGELLKGKRVSVLDIPDNYEYMQPELVELLKRRCQGII